MKKHVHKIMRALIDDFYTISVYFEDNVDVEVGNKLSFFSDGKVSDYSIKLVDENKVSINVDKINIKQLYHVAYGKHKVEAIPHNVLDNKMFHYDGRDLGVTYSREKTVFKVFSPVATSIIVNIYDSLESEKRLSIPLVEGEFGVWVGEIFEDLKNKFYSFNVDGALKEFNPEIDVVDPYAKCVIAKTKRAVIIDLDDTPYITPLANDIKHSDSIIYEIHVRDISVDFSSGAKNNGSYLALTENDTYLDGDTDTNIKTLTSHLKELGVNTIQIMPIQDFDSEEHNPNFYGWGYMPRYFNSPEGSYSSNWQDSSKVSEVKLMIDNLHKNGFKVVLDVVYNHTSEGFYGEGIYSFNAFIPYFYYRFGNGHISNGSGCGNELRTESFMVRKYIKDSLKFWTEFYGFDGFRFDLMGLIDLETMTEITEELRAIKKGIIIYGEPWTGGLTPIQPTYKGMQKDQGFFVFNDEFRDALKGAVFDKKEKGFVQTEGEHHYDEVIEGILGSINTFTSSPVETVNYIEVHDNHTLFDKLYFSLSENNEFHRPQGELLEDIKKLHKLSGFVLLTSQGIPVMHLGQDFLRTKNGIENSYNSGDVINKIDWNRKKEFYDVFCYYKHVIAIRNKFDLFRIDSEEKLRDAIHFRYDVFPDEKDKGIAYTLENDVEKIMVVINPYQHDLCVDLLEDGWQVFLSGDDYFESGDHYVNRNIELGALVGGVYYKKK